jgi:metal-responsive CopG/Arc/MetJ family transcriptional regulator
MPVRSVQISVDQELLDLVDQEPETKERGRSAVIREALRLYLARNREATIDAQYKKAYGRETRTEFDDMLPGQAWPSE